MISGWVSLKLEKMINKLMLFSMLLFLSGCSSNTSNSSQTMCQVDHSTPFGKKLLLAAKRISKTQSPLVYGKCNELEELKKGERTQLSMWQYALPFDEAKKLDLEDLPLKV